MADISSITLPGGSTYDFKDVKAREAAALEYDPLHQYSEYDYCFYNGVLYACIDDTPNPAGAFDEDYWMSTNLAGELTDVVNYLYSEMNNNKSFSKVKIGATTIEADSINDTLELAAGSNIKLTPNSTSDKVTISNSGVRSIDIGSTNGTISVNTDGTSADVAVKGLGSAAYTSSTDYISSAVKGAAGGVAELDSNGKVPSSQIPFDEVELPFMITKQPQPFVLETSSGNVTFSIEVSGGSGTYTYQWQMMTAALPWTDATGATSSSWTVSAGTTSIGMIARCVVSDGTDTLVSDTAYYYGQDDASDNLKYAVNDGNYGVCSTAGNDPIKTVTIPGLVVKTGVTIHVRFLHANSAEDYPKLNVNGCGAKYLVLYGNTAVGTYPATSGWQDDSIVAFTYNGTYWVRDQAYNTNTMSSNPAHGNGYGTCTTAASETAKEVTMSGYYIGDGGIVVIRFENNVPASSTLNINGKGAKSIYAKSSFGIGTIGANVIKAGDTATFIYDGSHYVLISIDRHNLVFDANPTQGSTNLMTSGALYTGFSLFADELAKLYLNDAQAFSNQSTYSVGALRIYNGELYQCHTAVETAGDWTGSTNWTRKSLGEFIEAYKNLATLEYVVVT